MKQINKPKFKRYIFAENAKEANIENVPDTQSEEQERQGYIGYQHGYTEYNMKPLTEGGKPPRGQQLNQVLKDITSVTQYATVGGTYGIDNDVINSTGYPKNAIICVDDVGLFRSLKDDNKEPDYKDTSSWKKVVDFKVEKNRTIGSLFYAFRTEEILDGALNCNGKIYNKSGYGNFVDNYLERNLIPSVSFAEYNKILTDNNYTACGFFGFEKNSDTFRVPFLNSQTFLSPANQTNNITYRRPRTEKDIQIPSKVGYFCPEIFPDINTNTGVAILSYQLDKDNYKVLYNSNARNSYRADPYSTSDRPTIKDASLNINFSKQFNIYRGGKSQHIPPTVFANLYVVVSENYTN